VGLTSSLVVAEADETVPTYPISYRGQFLLAKLTPQENGTSKEAQQRRSLEYGRLLPQYDPSSTNPKAEVLRRGSIHKEPRPPQNRTLEYGRLSPPPTTKGAVMEYDEASTHAPEPHSPFAHLPRRSASANSNAQLSPRANRRLAFRKEAYNAVLGIDGQHWDDIGLVSVSGHQVMEEEL
jgi:hypothetical protein